MSYKPDHQELMAYLYDELEPSERVKVEQYLMENPSAKEELQKLAGVSAMLKGIKDKEVIAPPIFLPEPARTRFLDTPYFKTIASIAASLIIVILVGRFTGASIRFSDNEMRLSFGKVEPAVEKNTPSTQAELTADDVRKMINESLQANNAELTGNWEESRARLEQSIKSNLSLNSEKMDVLVRQASAASRDQVQQYVSTLQADNMKMVKDYFSLTSAEQKDYIEGLLVDFAKYLQQQRRDDMQLVELRLNSIEQKSNVFQEETEQILTSIISSVGGAIPTETKY